MKQEDLDRTLAAQDGVVSRRQLLAPRATKPDLDAMVRRRDLARVHTGVYVNHTGALTWRQRAWAAVLYAAPAALYLESAGTKPSQGGIVHVAVDSARRVLAPDGMHVHRVVALTEQVRWNLSPPSVRPEDNLLALVRRAGSETDVVRLITEEICGRRTTVERVVVALDRRSRLRRRDFVRQVLDDVAAGTGSVLEHGYLTRVERAHGLPPASRQVVRESEGGREYRDIEYEEFGLVIELDGRLAHDSWDAAGRDADRDLDDHAAGRASVRLRYAQVFDHPCRTAARVAEVLQRRGWTGTPRGCSPACQLGRSGAPDTPDPPP
ncbi:hypothetical protein NPS01_34690 [Nocardioides psychrotolerans]|uniref:Transcriptional regulator, AbiEi antitoxin, Type IV TA system n=1 Tax=Nocardioides psychrotolerans TaxID=1005945 RepID=A0A1I3N8K4_9ACTN|nr:hypothetical protein [Nocardioides psychrotolerans]GEP39806.1 hypothetical protein NPS01_34690 [Nocardioides psychrotolerans]SFJ05568.1 hypothetical protein SAMN05216561_11751 [Nocardioides psychrotolerans]